jgi:hypothetical protein
LIQAFLEYRKFDRDVRQCGIHSTVGLRPDSGIIKRVLVILRDGT